jgi:hypothetical protein
MARLRFAYWRGVDPARCLRLPDDAHPDFETTAPTLQISPRNDSRRGQAARADDRRRARRDGLHAARRAHAGDGGSRARAESSAASSCVRAACRPAPFADGAIGTASNSPRKPAAISRTDARRA